MFRRLIYDTRYHVPGIFVLSVLLYFPLLGARDFWGHENEYAEVTRVMLRERDFLLLQANGTLWTRHPPLFFWLAALFSWPTGQVSEWSMRLVPAVSATVLMLFSYRFLARRFDARLAFLSTFVLATSLLTIHVERHLPINMVFFLFLMLSMFLLLEVIVFDSPRLAHSYGVWTCMGLACLTKGPVGTFLPVFVTVLYLFFTRGWKKALALRPFSGALLFLGIAGPWFIFRPRDTTMVGANLLFAQHNHPVDGLQLIYDYIGQFPKSVFYSVANFPVEFMPWSFFLIPAGLGLWRDRGKIRESAGLFLFLWLVAVFFLPQYFVEDHSHYLFLLAPPAAVAFGAFLDRLLLSNVQGPARWYSHHAVFVFCLFLMAAGAALPLAAYFQWPQLTLPNTVLGIAVVIAALSLLYALKHSDYPAIVCGFGILMVGINSLVHGLVLPPVNKIQVRPFAERIGTLIKPGSDIGIYAGGHSHNLNFYSAIERFQELRHYDELARFLTGSGPRFILANERNIGALKEYWRGKLEVVVKQTSGGSDVWFPAGGQWVLLFSCNQGCESTSAAANLGDRTSHSAEPFFDVNDEKKFR